MKDQLTGCAVITGILVLAKVNTVNGDFELATKPGDNYTGNSEKVPVSLSAPNDGTTA